MLRRLFMCLLLPAVCFSLKAQSGHFLFYRYSTENGLNSNSVYCTFQDEKGFIWIGTSEGLMRYDSERFTDYSDYTGSGIPSAPLTEIISPAPGKLMLFFSTLREAGLLDLKTNRYTKISIAANTQAGPRSSMKVYKNGKEILLLFSASAAVLVYDSSLNRFTADSRFRLPQHWLANTVYYDAAENNYWFSCDSGLALYNSSRKEMYSRHHNPHGMGLLADTYFNGSNWAFFIDSKRRCWTLSWPASQKGMEILACRDLTGKLLPKDTTGWWSLLAGYREIRFFSETKGGILWAYGTGGLYSLLPGQNRWLGNRNDYYDNYGIKYNQVNHLMQDREGGIWISTDRGLYFTPPPMDSIQNISAEGKAFNVNDVYELNDGRILLNTWGAGTKVYNPGNTGGRPYDLYPPVNGSYKELEMVWCTHQHSSTGKVYIGAQFGWLGIYDPATGKTERRLNPVFANRTIRQIKELPNGDLLFATQYGKLIRLSNGRFEELFDCGTIIYSMVIDKNSHAWLGTHDKGIYQVNGQNGQVIRHFKNKEGAAPVLASNIVTRLKLYKDSLLFAATGKLTTIVMKTGTTTITGAENGLPGNSIEAMELDKKGLLWMVTAGGLCSYHPERGLFSRYGYRDGIADATILGGPSVLLRNNMIFLAGSEGRMLLFNPAKLSTARPPGNVVITGIEAGGVFYTADSATTVKTIITPFSRNSLSVSFSALSYLDHERITYYYMLQGLDDTWKQAAPGMARVVYNYLPAGEYTFAVKAVNADGTTSKEVTAFSIRITPPFWKTRWFIATLLTLAAMIGYAMHRLRIKRIMAVENLRNRVARDLHDDMGSTLSTISILSAMARMKLDSDTGKTGEYISRISDNSQRMMEAMDDIIWAIKPANDSMQKVVGRMREFATSVFEAKDIELEFTAAAEVNDARINMEARRDLFLVFKEAVNNAAKYARCSRAEVRLHTENRKLVLSVKDNGTGFDVNTADSGNGLGNMRKRADALKGKLKIITNAGEGTAVILTIPLN